MSRFRIFHERKDVLGGLLMLLLGSLAALQGARYSVGSLQSMGPGFFPVALGAVLACLGAILAVQGVAAATESVPQSSTRPEWRGWLCLSAGIGLFVLLGRYGGLLPATFAVVFVSALGDRRNTLTDAALLAFVATVVAVGVFSYGLSVQFPLLSWG